MKATRVGRVCALLAALALLWGSAGGQAVAAGGTSLTPAEIYQIAKLATVMVVGRWSADISVPQWQISSSAMSSLRQEALSLAQQGQIPQTNASVRQAMMVLALHDPVQYLQPGNASKTATASMVSEGSGFFVTPDGYLVTNAHVVKPATSELTQGLVVTSLKKFVASFTQNDEQVWAHFLGTSFPSGMVQPLQQADTQYIEKYLRVSNLKTAYNLELSSSIPGVAIGQKGVPASIAVVGTPTPGKDVAILKIEGVQNMPVLPLGDESKLQVGSQLLVVGFPGDATFLPDLATASYVEPTLTQGIYSRSAQMAGGWTALQTDATMHPGNSGGPVLDDAGQVVGLATFGTVNSQTGGTQSGENFVVPASLVKEFLNRINVHPQASRTSDLYRQGILQAAGGNWRAALTSFKAVDALLPGNPFVQQQIQAAESAIQSGKGGPSGSSTTYVLIGVGVLLLAAIAALASRRSRRPAAALTFGGSPGPGPLPPAHEDGAEPSAPPARFCGSCGAAAESGQKFCGSCGAAL